MTKTEFIAAIETKPQFVKWAKLPELSETFGDVQRWQGLALTNVSEGSALKNIVFAWDSVTDVATWWAGDAIEPEKNSTQIKLNALTNYLKGNFLAFFVTRTDIVNSWAEADVFTVSGQDVAKSSVIVYKSGNNPITHAKII